ncbi:amidohydrolase family protein [Flavobacterium poyangense]|uniref:amidohydrolase family protein n=1 Tax=Flavobacterium poyangense TaxID=2204302 RepID=UPI00141D87F9|nr:amidohydrolase family protein [Flavobacterium sp. JXAS1]
MTRKLILITLLQVLSFPLFAQTYITNVTLADVEKQKLIPNQTVVITNELISKIQSSKIKIPANATVIDGTGKYLFPGLTDAHVHFFQNGGLYTRPDVINLSNEFPYSKEIELAHQTMETKLRRYLQNGITNVIDVGASYSYLKQRALFKDSNYAPSIYMTGPLLTTYEPKVYENLKDEAPFSLVKSVDDGIKMVREQLPYHPDFIKIWYITGTDGLETEASALKNLPVIKAIIEEAHKNKLRVAVHATERITAQLAVENGCDFLVHSVDDEIIKDDFVKLLKKNKTILCPTLQVSSGYENTLGQKLKISNHELQTADPFQLGSLLDLRHLSDTLLVNKYKKYMNSEDKVAKDIKTNAILLENLKKLSDAGVLIATGTDAGNIGTLHASSYLNELLAMQKSGMNNWQIIQASTINGAKVLNKENEFGTITAGKKANLILLNANPVDTIENFTKIYRVINKGVVLDPATLIEETPIALAQRQLNAYNFRNIDAFLEPYADDVEIYLFPDKLMYKGKEEMRKEYSQMFDSTPNLHCQLLNRIVQKNIVIDQERVQVRDKIVEATAIYHIKNNKIQKVYFVY